MQTQKTSMLIDVILTGRTRVTVVVVVRTIAVEVSCTNVSARAAILTR